MEIELLLENSHVRLADHVIVSHADAGDRSRVSTVKGMCVLLVPVLLGVIMFSLLFSKKSRSCTFVRSGLLYITLPLVLFWIRNGRDDYFITIYARM